MAVEPSCLEQCAKSPLAVFCGAGSSAFLGIPLMHELTERIKDRIDEDLFHSICNDTNNADIEVVINYIENLLKNIMRTGKNKYLANLLQTNSSLAEKAVYTLNQIVEDIKHNIYEIINDVDIDSQQNKLIGAFNGLLYPVVNLIAGNNLNFLPVITTNYDLVLERIDSCEFFGRVIDGMYYDDRVHVRDTKWIGHENVADYTMERLNIGLFKLHGSINWYYNKESKEIISSPHISRINTIKYERLIIPPSIEKTGECEKHELYKNMFNNAKKAIYSAKIILAIGYSFRDPRINFLFRDALGDERKKLIIIDPAPADVIQRLRSFMGGRIAKRIFSVDKHFNEKGIKLYDKVIDTIAKVMD